jgi:hypothetical protein
MIEKAGDVEASEDFTNRERCWWRHSRDGQRAAVRRRASSSEDLCAGRRGGSRANASVMQDSRRESRATSLRGGEGSGA